MSSSTIVLASGLAPPLLASYVSLSSKEMETLLLEELKIATVAGTSFGEYGEGYIRFSYANSQKNILEALNRIHEYAIENKWG